MGVFQGQSAGVQARWSGVTCMGCAGLHDPRVGYWEPAKYVAKLREHKTDSNMLIFKCDMGAGELHMCWEDALPLFTDTMPSLAP